MRRGFLATGAALCLLGLLATGEGCQSIAGFDDRHHASSAGQGGGGVGGAAGTAGDAGASGEGGAAGVMLVGKQVPERPADEAGSKTGNGDRLVFVLSALSFGLLEDTPQWPTIGYNLDNSCEKKAVGCVRSTTIEQGDDCTDNGVGQALKFALQLESRISNIESQTNARLPTGRTLLLELANVNPTKEGDDAYVPGHLYVLAPAEMDDQGKPLPRKLDPIGLPLPIESMLLEEGSMPPARVHFPHGYLRGNVWVSGDLGEEHHGPLYLPLSGEVSSAGQDLLGQLRSSQLSLTLTLDATLSTVTSSTMAGVLDIEDLQNDLLPSFAEFQDCNPKLVRNALHFLEGYADMPEPGQDPEDGCKRISVGIGLSWQTIDKVTEVRATPVPSACATEICSPGTARCTEAGPQTCGDDAAWGSPTACSADDPICIDGQCTHPTRLVADGSTTCALFPQGPPRCWGKASFGTTGAGRSFLVSRPLAIPNLYDAVDLSTLNSHHICALRKGGKVSCWGSNTSGRLGLYFGDQTVEGPYEVPGLSGVTALALGDTSSCALIEGGAVVCWGDNLNDQLGSKIAGGTPTPSPVVLGDGSPLVGVKSLSLGAQHGCAITTDNKLYCWGQNEDGQLVLPLTTGRSPFAALVPGTPAILTAVAGGNGATFLLDDQETLYVAGKSYDGQLAGLTPDPGQLLPVPGLQVQQIATSRFHHVIVRSGSKLYGSGHNDLGQLAIPAKQTTGCDTDMDDCKQPGACVLALTPLEVGGEVLDVATGENHTCAIFADKKVRCWGDQLHGELGDGVIVSFAACAPVPEPREVKW